jgi:type II secretory pathway component PulF
MPVFVYTGRTKNGEPVTGTIDAVDRRTAILEIERRGIIPSSIEDKIGSQLQEATRSVRRRFIWRRGGPRMSRREMLVFTSELSDLLASGMTLGNALNCLALRNADRDAGMIIGQLRDEIIGGASLSDALGRHPGSFPDLYVNMIRAGEASGALHEVLNRLVDHYERVQQTKEKIAVALVYPLIVVFFGAITLVFAMVYVVPKFEEVFAQMRQALPLPTRILIFVSRALAHYGWLIAIFICLGILAMTRWLKTEKGRLWFDRLVLKMPVVKSIVASGIYANMARTLGTLLKNGVPALQALKILENTIGNRVLALEIRSARERVTDGTSISGPLAASGVFPRIMTEMLAVGEQSGDLPGALGHIARRYENELERNLKIFTTALEPILIILVAILVGFIAIGILSAVFSFTNGLAG